VKSFTTSSAGCVPKLKRPYWHRWPKN